MQESIGVVKGQLGKLWPPVAGLVTLNGPLLTSYNPSRPDQVVGVVQAADGSDVEEAIRQAGDAWPAWRDMPVAERVRILQAAASLMRARRETLAAWEILECGKPWREADADIAEAIDFLEYYAAEGLRLSTPKRLGHEPGELNHRLVSPRGITAVIAPWNFPLAIPTGMVSAALVTGNPVIFKPSERSPLVGRMLGQYHASPMRILALAGDGIGPEITAVAVEACRRFSRRWTRRNRLARRRWPKSLV